MTEVKESFGAKRGGWIPDIPDGRDFAAADFPAELHGCLLPTDAPRPKADLSEFFQNVPSPTVQGQTVAWACGSLIDYFNRRCLGKLTTTSKPFLHAVARRLEGRDSASGPSIRSTLKTLRRVGAPPDHCAVDVDCDLSRDPLLFAYAERYRALTYYRIDDFQSPPEQRLELVRQLLLRGFPTVFGMSTLASIGDGPFVDFRPMDELLGGAAVVCVGFDDHLQMSTRGALKFLGPWGKSWGDNGFGWLSYRFIEEGLVRDIWTAYHPIWTANADLPIQVSR